MYPKSISNASMFGSNHVREILLNDGGCSDAVVIGNGFSRIKKPRIAVV